MMPKKAGAKVVGRRPRFRTSAAILSHLKRHEHRVVISGVVSPLEGSEAHIGYSPNGSDWLAIPVEQIEDARLMSRTQVGPDLLSTVQLTLSPTNSSEGNLLSQLISLHQAQFSRFEAAPPSSPPPICPNGVARWVVDHWECV